MTLRSFACAVLSALMLTGCAALPPADRPDVAVPVVWNQETSSEAPDDRLLREWWTAFGSPELTTLIDLSRRNNPDLAAAARRIAQATANVRIAGSGLYPALDASTSASRNWQGERSPLNGFDAAFDASYEVDLWGLNRLNAASAAASLAATEYDHDTVAIGLTAEVAVAYLQYLSLGDRLENARRILDTAERVLDFVEKRQELGAASGLELAQQRGAVATLRASLPSLEQSRAETLNGLALLLGTTPGQLRIAANSLAAVRLPVVAAGLPSDLLERRPDLRRAEADLAAARADVGAARAALFPSIRLTAGTGFASTELASLFTPAGFFANLAAGIVGPIFDGGQLAGQRDLAEARAAELVEAYRGAVIAAFRDTEDALAAIRYLEQIEAAQRDAEDHSQRAYDLAQVQYRAGSVDFLAVLETQRNLFQQQDSLEQTRLARVVAAANLFKALGGGW
jgi:outer membrane protein, multidrug efflux system